MDSEQNNGAQAPRERDQAGAGAMLRQAREAQGLSLGDVATRTRIPIRQLEVIEAGAFASLPSRTYAVGFARTYARAVGLDEADVTAAVRAELGDPKEARSVVPGGMEPGDPAKLPSRSLAWAGGIAALLLAAGLFAWFASQYRAGEGAAPLIAETEDVAPTAPAQAPVTAAPGTPAGGGGEVVFTALSDGIWVRLFDAGGERILEKTLAKGESFAVPATARDPRINTARPDALGLTIDGKPARPLSARAVVLASEPVSAAALLARTAVPADAAAGGEQALRGASAPARRRSAERRSAAPVTEATTPASAEAAPAAAPATAPAPAPAPAPAAATPSAEGEG